MRLSRDGACPGVCAVFHLHHFEDKAPAAFIAECVRHAANCASGCAALWLKAVISLGSFRLSVWTILLCFSVLGRMKKKIETKHSPLYSMGERAKKG